MLGSLHQPVIPHSTFFILFCEFFQYLLSFFPFML